MFPHPYPEGRSARDAWIVAKRPARTPLDPLLPSAFFVEDERSREGQVVPVATVFLTNRECPWRCVMCDLWRHTVTETVGPGVIPGQIRHALSRMPPARQIKLYNAGSFFDPGAIPPGDDAAIAELAAPFEATIVECHPALVGDRCFRFHDALNGRLEVAMGLETAHPGVLSKLNKRMTLAQFASAADRLRRHGIALRVFILVQPPFLAGDEALHWAKRSLDFAFSCGASAATLIPTREGNGAMEELKLQGQFAPPPLSTLEAAAEYGLTLGRARVFSDVWDLSQSASCPQCRPARIERLRRMNLSQTILPRIECAVCVGGL